MLAGGMAFSDRGLELTRNFKALKLWMSLKTHGVSSLAALIEQNMQQAQHLSDVDSRRSGLELLAPTSMNIVCFRYRPSIDRQEVAADVETLNRLNRELGGSHPGVRLVHRVGHGSWRALCDPCRQYQPPQPHGRLRFTRQGRCSFSAARSGVSLRFRPTVRERGESVRVRAEAGAH